VVPEQRVADPLGIFEFFRAPRSVVARRVVLGWSVTEKVSTMSDTPVVLINVLKVDPEKQDALIALLKQSTETVIRSLAGWNSTRLVAARDGASVVIISEWQTSDAIEAMREDPRMKAYFPKIAALASFESFSGPVVQD